MVLRLLWQQHPVYHIKGNITNPHIATRLHLFLSKFIKKKESGVDMTCIRLVCGDKLITQNTTKWCCHEMKKTTRTIRWSHNTYLRQHTVTVEVQLKSEELFSVERQRGKPSIPIGDRLISPYPSLALSGIAAASELPACDCQACIVRVLHAPLRNSAPGRLNEEWLSRKL